MNKETKDLLKEIRAIKRKSPRTLKGLAKKYPKKSLDGNKYSIKQIGGKTKWKNKNC